MATFKARGIIIKENLINDTDKSLIILLKDYGKANVWVKNCRSSKSKLLYGSSLFTYADFILYDNGKSISLNQIDSIHNFYDLSQNLDTLAYATYFLEFIEKNTPEATPINEIILLLLKSLLILSKDCALSSKLICAIFELKFLHINGYAPVTNCCSNCQKPIQDIKNPFFCSDGLLCQECKGYKSNYMPISLDTIYVINHILSSNLDNLFNFNVSDKILNYLCLANKIMLSEHFQINLKTKDFIEDIEKFNQNKSL